LTVAKYDGFGDEDGIDDSTDSAVGLCKTGFAWACCWQKLPAAAKGVRRS